MCGIGGGMVIQGGASLDPHRLELMSREMAHRGPDDDGVWIHPRGHVGLVHRRLSIIDLTTGHQPLHLADQSGVIVFNGEIYNYKELREGLGRNGGGFLTQSDTEVLLKAYMRDGADCLSDLWGMFVFAIWDERTQSLFLARDRIGKKPLYHTVEDGCIYFASTLNALLAGSLNRRDMDVTALGHFLDLGYIPAPHCIWKGISKLPAAHFMRIDEQGIHKEQYWDLSQPREPFQGSFEAGVDRLDELLNQAVSIRLRSDVPLGVFLSGGIDSSLVSAVAVKQAAGNVQTFSIGFSEQEFDESGYAKTVADLLGTEHRTFVGRPRMLELLPDVVRHFGEPFGDSSSLNVWMLSEETRKHVTVALGGDGGDEGFAGYLWYRTLPRIQRLRRLMTPWGARLARQTVELLPEGLHSLGRVRRALRAIELEPSQGFGHLRTFLGPDETRGLLSGELLRPFQGGPSPSKEWIAHLFEKAGGTTLHKMRSADVSSYLADCLMPKVDVATMAHGLEARAPLLDHRVLEFSTSLPDEWLSDANDGKILLRAVLERYIPKEVFDRPKMGFSVPLDMWFSAGVNGILDRLTESPALLDTGWFRRPGIEAMIASHKVGARDHSQRLYNLLVLDEWLQLNGP